jgi:hypothetical protein
MDSTATALARFQRDRVDLDPQQVKTARASRDFLVEQINALRLTKGFPPYTGGHLPFGSFSRRTKIQPLDDVDTLFFINGGKTTENRRDDGVTVWLRIEDATAPLAAYRDDYAFVNSTRVLNATRDGLGGIKLYKKADVKKNMEAVTLALSSYPWVFDIVPAVSVNDGQGGTAHYLIPDGRGEWKRADLRGDAKRTEALNAARGNAFTPLCRLLKYWNNRTHKPQLPAYYFETLVGQVFATAAIHSTSGAVHTFFKQASALVAQSCPDPNCFGPNLDAGIDWATKQKVISAMNEAESNALTASVYPLLAGHDNVALSLWRKVFGPEFGT